jgi:hypothetical protein
MLAFFGNWTVGIYRWAVPMRACWRDLTGLFYL